MLHTFGYRIREYRRRLNSLSTVVSGRLAEPIHVNLFALLALWFGSTRTKIDFDLLERRSYAFGMLSAADKARQRGVSEIVAIEFGVAAGAGLLNMCELAKLITAETGVSFQIIGFDTGIGMPTPRDYRDHPEHYNEGDFPMDQAALQSRLPRNAQLILGEISQTAPRLLETMTAQCPIGFVAVDVDYYSSTVDTLHIFDGNSSFYLPTIDIYFDDVEYESHNPWCGELLAIEEFNRDHELRKIAPHRSLRAKRLLQRPRWIDHMFTLHVLDHPTRHPALPPVKRVLENPYLADS